MNVENGNEKRIKRKVIFKFIYVENLLFILLDLRLITTD